MSMKINSKAAELSITHLARRGMGRSRSRAYLTASAGIRPSLSKLGLKYECVYLHAFETGSELRAGLARWIGFYNAGRPHSALAGLTPDEAYWGGAMERLAA
jgi:transposase InsO family protein